MADLYAPTYYIRAKQPGTKDGPRVDITDKVLSFVYADNDSKADKLTLTVDNFDLSHFDDPVWKAGSVIEVSWGYPGKMAIPRSVQIKSVKGFSELTIEGYGLEMLAHKESKSRVFENTTRSNVVTEIAKELGYSGEELFIQDTKTVYESIAQANLTDAAFIKRLAYKEGFEWYVDFDGFHFHERNLYQKASRVFTYYNIPSGEAGSIITINIKNDVTAKPAKVCSKGRSPETRSDVSGCASNDDAHTEDRQGLAHKVEIFSRVKGGTVVGHELRTVEGKDGQEKGSTQKPVVENTSTQAEARNIISRVEGGKVIGHEVVDSAPGQEKIVTTSEETDQGAQKDANKRFRRAQQTAVELEMDIVGDPRIVAKSVFELRNVGKRLSQLYYAKTVKHNIDANGGYVISIEALSDGSGGHSTKSVYAPGLSSIDVSDTKSKKPNKPTDQDVSNDIQQQRADALNNLDQLVKGGASPDLISNATEQLQQIDQQASYIFKATKGRDPNPHRKS